MGVLFMKKICFITTVPATIDSFILETAKYIHNETDWDISFICDEDVDFSINNKEIMKQVSNTLNDYAFIVKNFEYDTNLKILTNLLT